MLVTFAITYIVVLTLFMLLEQMFIVEWKKRGKGKVRYELWVRVFTAWLLVLIFCLEHLILSPSRRLFAALRRIQRNHILRRTLVHKCELPEKSESYTVILMPNRSGYDGMYLRVNVILKYYRYTYRMGVELRIEELSIKKIFENHHRELPWWAPQYRDLLILCEREMRGKHVRRFIPELKITKLDRPLSLSV